MTFNTNPTHRVSLEAERDRLAQRLERVERRLTRAELFGEDDYSVGEVIKFTAYYTNNRYAGTGPLVPTPYTYVALKYSETQWVRTSGNGGQISTWGELVQFMLDRDVEEVFWASEYTQVV